MPLVNCALLGIAKKLVGHAPQVESPVRGGRPAVVSHKGVAGSAEAGSTCCEGATLAACTDETACTGDVQGARRLHCAPGAAYGDTEPSHVGLPASPAHR